MNSIKININELEIGDDDVAISLVENEKYFDYNENQKTNLVLLPNSGYTAINFSGVTTPLLLRVVSDKKLNVKVNNNVFSDTYMLLLNTTITSIEVANVDLLNANVQIAIWGKQ